MEEGGVSVARRSIISKAEYAKRKAGKWPNPRPPIAPVAEEISEEACLLCFDNRFRNIAKHFVTVTGIDYMEEQTLCWKTLLSAAHNARGCPLYDHKVRVVILADHPLEDIFVHDGDHGHDESHILMDDLGLKRDEASSLSIFSGEEEKFAFQRTVSRLTEMQTDEYWLEGDRSTKSQV
ncbi:AFG1 like ATPase a isoform X2 [Lates japonicus]|uniref:AFG1 like ATPase a isoform X2 n=1 Tax=Lates japonicus TaxID=270547 RepID=A0AAD3M581_LATJO|nr:AFG1 like ATPase a isoform X2 [Lates japonicus]